MLSLINGIAPFTIADVPGTQTGTYNYSASLRAPDNTPAGVALELTYSLTTDNADYILEYSTDGTTWTAFTSFPQTARPAGTYRHSCVLPVLQFGGYVRVGIKKSTSSANGITNISGTVRFLCFSKVSPAHIVHPQAFFNHSVAAGATEYSAVIPLVGAAYVTAVCAFTQASGNVDVGLEVSNDGATFDTHSAFATLTAQTPSPVAVTWGPVGFRYARLSFKANTGAVSALNATVEMALQTP
jgi:hypothetical protein